MAGFAVLPGALRKIIGNVEHVRKRHLIPCLHCLARAGMLAGPNGGAMQYAVATSRGIRMVVKDMLMIVAITPRRQRFGGA